MNNLQITIMTKEELNLGIDLLIGKRVEKLYAVIDGQHMMLNELEVRYLQVRCAMAINYRDFCKRVILHNGPTKKSPILHFEKSGRFKESIIDGFYSPCAAMALRLSRIERLKQEKTRNNYKF